MRRGEADPAWPQEFIEQLAERFGSRMPKAAARMLGALVATGEPDLSSRQLVELLGLSPAAVSNSGRLLLQMDLVDRTVSPETRRDHYRLRENVWPRMFRGSFAIVEDTLALLDETLDETRGGTRPEGPAGQKIREMRDFYRFVYRELPEVLERYEKWRAGQYREPGA
ncbi:GbsR/MarR family transcriptional regulator [Amycolatopsis panacis]|nr:MarR family transcriptional regulator [Amycolatopsis panacis]